MNSYYSILILVFFFQINVIKTNAQEFLIPKKTWTFLEAVSYPNHIINRGFCYKIGIDTMVNSVKYNKLLIANDCENYNLINGFIRENEEGKVFYKYNNPLYEEDEYLLYDFNMSVGDTASLGWGNSLHKLDSINLNKEGKKVYYFTISSSQHEIWIEGVGSTIGLLRQRLTGGTLYLNCCLLNDEILYHNPKFDDCYYNEDEIIVDAGNDTTICMGFYTDSVNIGTNARIVGGTKPYKIAWECNAELFNRHYTASDILVDTTVLSPTILPDFTYFDKLEFNLRVIDSVGYSASDSLTVNFSRCGCTTGYSVIFLNKGDSVWLDAGEPDERFVKKYFEPSYGLTFPDSSGTWCKPEVTTDYSIVSVDSTGCSCSCHAYEIRVWGTDFAPIGAKWYYRKSEGWHPPNEGYVLLESIKDTTIQDLNCRVISKTYYHSNGQNVSRLGFEYVHEKDGKVLYWRKGSFYTLYDFNAQPGDEWTVCGSYINENLCVNDTLATIKVDSISLTKINNHVLRVLHTSSPNGNWEYPDKIIERIGCLSYLFPQPVICAFDIPYEAGPLRCYSDLMFGRFRPDYYSSLNYDCDRLVHYTGIQNQEYRFSVYPNPATNQITISNRQNINIKSVELIDNTGRKIKQWENLSFGENVLNLENILPGVYFLRIEIGNEIMVEKLLIGKR
jgi:hypothetical protein